MIAHMIYHLAPFNHSDAWLCNLQRLFSFLDVFNGVRMVAIATGDDMVAPEAIEELLRRRRCDRFRVENDHDLRETTSFFRLLKSVQSRVSGTQELLWYGHSKGVSFDTKWQYTKRMAAPEIPVRWRNGLYIYTLAEPEIHWDAIRRGAYCSGPYRCTGRRRRTTGYLGGKFPSGLTTSNPWHYAGTFWWVDCEKLFGHEMWGYSACLQDGWAVEGFLPSLFGMEKSFCSHWDNWIPRHPHHFGPFVADDMRYVALKQEIECINKRGTFSDPHSSGLDLARVC